MNSELAQASRLKKGKFRQVDDEVEIEAAEEKNDEGSYIIHPYSNFKRG